MSLRYSILQIIAVLYGEPYNALPLFTPNSLLCAEKSDVLKLQLH